MPLSVLVCRGCCCGTDKHPDVDHAGQVAALRRAVPAGGRLWTVDCLGPCERSNVVVVRADARRAWFGGVLEGDDTAALAEWIGAGAPGEPPARLAPRRFDPQASPVGFVEALGLSPDGIARLVEGTLREDAGPWTLGIQGAVAEFAYAGDGPDVRRAGRTVETVTARGGLRLAPPADTVAFVLTAAPGSKKAVTVFLAVPRATLPAPATAVTLTRGDPEALRVQDRDAWLVDLGLGRPGLSFGLRTDDPDLVARLRAVAGRPWAEALGEVGPVLVARSPHRVVRTPAGRAEIYSPIPPPGGASPKGPHTHLLPPELELGLELPAGVVLPAEYVAAASFHPLPGWRGPVDGHP